MQFQPHILCVEDDRDTREMLKAVLSRAGFRVSVTAGSTKVLRLLKVLVFDAVILDNCMPEMSGLELCRKIHSFDQSTPIFFCSGAATEADKAAALASGAQGYITKRFDTDELVSTLWTALETSKKQSA